MKCMGGISILLAGLISAPALKRQQESASSMCGNKRTSQGDCRLPETLLEVEKDAGADSCSNSRTKEKHSQLALDDGNPLTVQPESIRDCLETCGGGVGGSV